MKRPLQAHGYTIIETMIFLVITGVLLASALLVFNGRQRRTQFTQGVREIESQIQGIINETASGYYPNKGNIACTSSGGGGPQPSLGNTDQGQNEGCIFLGRVLQFSPGDTYTAYTVVGQRTGADGREVTSLSSSASSPDANSAKQTLLAPSSPSQPDFPDASQEFTLPWGITVTKVVVPSVSPPQIGAFGFITSLGSYSANGNNLISGSSGLSLIPLEDTSLDSQPEATIAATKAMGRDPQNPGRIVLCLRSGGDDRQAAIILGGNGNNVGTEVMIDNVPEECSGA